MPKLSILLASDVMTTKIKVNAKDTPVHIPRVRDKI